MTYRKLKIAKLFGLILILSLAACDEVTLDAQHDDLGEKADIGAPNLSQEEELSIICYRYGMRFEVYRDVREQS